MYYLCAASTSLFVRLGTRWESNAAFPPLQPSRALCHGACRASETVVLYSTLVYRAGATPFGVDPLVATTFFDDSRFNPLIQYAAPKQAASSDDQLPLCVHAIVPFTTFSS